MQLAVHWNLPPQVTAALQRAVLSGSSAFQTFHMVLDVNAGSGELAEYLGVVRQANGHGQLALAHVEAHIGLRKVFDYVERTSCGTCFLVGRCCEKYRDPVPRGYTPTEMAQIESALRATSYQHLVRLMGDRGKVNPRLRLLTEV